MKENTVLILGAGASVDYGYPTGRELTELIGNNAKYILFRDRILRHTNDYREAYTKGFDLIQKHFFKSRSLSIDSWLAKKENRGCEAVGKLLISYFISKNENDRFQRGHFFLHQYNNEDKRSDWYQLLLKTLIAENFDDFPNTNNKLTIITFNYDRSLEYYLLNTIQNTYIGKNEEECWDKILEIPIIHVYGMVGNLPISNPSDSIPYGRNNLELIQDYVNRSNKLKIIPEMRKEDDQTIALIRKSIKDAERIYFIGFSYDIDNLTLLGFPMNLKNRKALSIIGTSFGMEEGEIEIAKKYARICVTESNCVVLNPINCDAYSFFRKEVIKAFYD